MNLPVSPRFDGVFYDICAFLEVFLNLFSPEAEDDPALFLEYLVDLPITFYVPFDFRNPEFPARLDIFFAVLPVVPVPEFAIAEHGDLLSDEGYVGFSWNGFDVFAVAKAA